MINQRFITGMVEVIQKEHLELYFSASVTECLNQYWQDKMAIVWTAEDVNRLENEFNKPLRLEQS